MSIHGCGEPMWHRPVVEPVDVIAAMAAPGWQARRRRPLLGWCLLALGIGLPAVVGVGIVVSRRSWLALTLDSGFLGRLTIVASLAVVARLVAAGELWFSSGAKRSFDRTMVTATAIVLAVCVPIALVAVQATRTRATLAPVFSPTDKPLWLADVESTTSTVPAPTTTATTAAFIEPVIGADRAAAPTTSSTTSTTSTSMPLRPAPPDSGVDPALLADVSTVLLLGGDAGPGRAGLRTDTMMLFSLHRPSGRAALVSLPRDTKRILFPPGSALEAHYPSGFGELANAVYPYVSVRRDLRDAYAVDGVRPGVVALGQAIGYSLDVTIDDYVLVDMQGFADVVDALGGVTVDVPRAVPMPGNVPGARAQYPDTIGPGTIHMDGSTALGYARSRKADSDFQRTARQRTVLAALARQVSFENVALSFHDVVSSVGSTLRTSLEPDELAEVLAVFGGETAIVESVGLVPPLMDIEHPDWQQLAEAVGEVQLAIVTGEPSGR